MENEFELNLANILDERETALVGREHGEEVLKLLKEKKYILKELEEKYEQILIEIPKKIVTINKSFFLGLFETRIQEMGKEKFENKYVFKTSEHIVEKIKKHINAALLNATQKEIVYE